MWVGHRVILPEHRDLVLEQKRKEQVYHPPELAADSLEEIGRVIEWSLVKKNQLC